METLHLDEKVSKESCVFGGLLTRESFFVDDDGITLFIRRDCHSDKFLKVLKAGGVLESQSFFQHY